MDENVRLDLEKYLAITDKEFEKIREFVVGDSGEIARLQMCRLAVAPGCLNPALILIKKGLCSDHALRYFLTKFPARVKRLGPRLWQI